MQVFRRLLKSEWRQILGVVLAYVLVVNALAMPLRAVHAWDIGHDPVLCTTIGEAVAWTLDENHKDRSNSQGSDHQDCMIACLFHGIGTTCLNENKQFTIALSDKKLIFIFKNKYFDFDKQNISILALGKAPNAPPAIV